MRKRFEQQFAIGTKLISDIIILLKSRDAIPAMLLALKEIFINPEYNSNIFCILEDKLIKGNNKTGRPGMDLWQIFVLAQFRVGLNLTFDRLVWMVNHDYYCDKYWNRNRIWF